MSVPKPPRHAGLDALRATAIVTVFLWHAQIVRIDELASTGPWVAAAKALRFVLSYEVALMAVPALMLVSLVLFTERFIEHGWPYARRRAGRLARVLAFWLAVQYAAAFAFARAFGTSAPPADIAMVLTGGPDVLGAGSVLWFLVDLLTLTLLAALYLSIAGNRRRWLVGACLALASAGYFEWSALTARAVGLQSIAAFVVLIPAAELVLARGKRLQVFAWGGFAAFVAHDLVLRGLEAAGRLTFHASSYGRLACVFGATALVALALEAPVRLSRTAEYLSRYSLGLFAVHKNALGVAALLIGAPAITNVAGIVLDWSPVLTAALAALGTGAVVAVIAASPLRRAVS